MANENVKIIIQEDNLTKPLGDGSSSDIVYVPGLAIERDAVEWDEDGVEVEWRRVDGYDAEGNFQSAQKIDEVTKKLIWNPDAPLWTPQKNIPILCNTVAEFESLFGIRPYRMTADDVNTAVIRNYKENDLDKSYIIAKELLNAGLSVMYENIAAPAESFKRAAAIRATSTATEEYPNLRDNGNNTFTYTACKDVTNSKYTFAFNLQGDPLYGAVSVIINTPDSSDLSVTPPSVIRISGTKDKFKVNISADKKYRTITWENITAADFVKTTFEFDLEVEYKGTSGSEDFLIGVDVVTGANVRDGANVSAVSKIDYFYNNIPDALDRLRDKSEYTVKYLTTGGYPSFIIDDAAGGEVKGELADKLIDVAKDRGDAVAIVDHSHHSARPLAYHLDSSVYAKVNDWFSNGKGTTTFGTMFTPYAMYTCPTIEDVDEMSQILPASFGYLMCLANAIKTRPNWLAMAGITRGIVPNLKYLDVQDILSNVVAEDYQPKFGSEDNKISINAITNVKPYGLAIWGNRTLEPVDPKGTTALNFLNTRNMISDIKKLAYTTAKSLMFEQDSDTLWLDFKSGMSPLLEQLKSGYGISNYKIIRSRTKYNGKSLTRGEMAAVIKIYPLYAIEYFEITVAIADEDVTVS